MDDLYGGRTISHKPLSWEEWKKRWDTETTVEGLEDLLHRLYRVPIHSRSPDREERTRLLFKLADARTSSPYRVQRLMTKAQRILVDELFVQDVPRPGDYDVSRDTVEAILDFFTPGPDSEWANLLMAPDTVCAKARAYIYKIKELIWSGHFGPGLRPKLLEVLSCWGMLETLIPNSTLYERSWNEFDDETLQAIEQIALQKHSSVEIAVFHGSYPAKFLTVVRAALKGRHDVREKTRLESEIADRKRQLDKL